jgi:hypothetical protein
VNYITANLLSGLVSGVIVALLLVGFRSFWDQILVPWFEERVYKDARIEGKWFSLYPTTEENRQEVITLTRHGHTVTGTMICIVGDDEGEQYQLSGSFRNLILPLVYETESKSKTDRGTLTLKLVGNAQELRGKLASYFTVTDGIATTDVIWFRSKSDLERMLEQIAPKEKQIEAIRLRERESDAAKRKLTETPTEGATDVQEEHQVPRSE